MMRLLSLTQLRPLLVVVLSSVCVFILCEYAVHMLGVFACEWPELNDNEKTTNVMLLSDPHLLGVRKGHWFDKLRRLAAVCTVFEMMMIVLFSFSTTVRYDLQCDLFIEINVCYDRTVVELWHIEIDFDLIIQFCRTEVMIRFLNSQLQLLTFSDELYLLFCKFSVINRKGMKLDE